MTPDSSAVPASRSTLRIAGGRSVRAVALAALLLGGCSPPGPSGGAPDRADSAPLRTDYDGARLVVLVVVDQLSADLLTRYADVWTGGFRRLLDEGLVFTQATHDHAFTETAAGHATLATGVVPARHGIVANTWTESDGEGSWRSRYAVADPSVRIVGSTDEEGRSPVAMLRDGVASWVRAANPGARVVSVSRKDRSAITMAGDVEDAHVYWISGVTGRFVTSSWYRDRLPSWVERVNRDVLPGVFADTVWESSVPPSLAARTRPDTASTEGRNGFSWFPHRALVELSDPTVGLNDWILHTPAPDGAVLALGLEALAELDLGRGPGPDFLALGFSQADYVGHWFGPWSREQLDNLLRLDRRMGDLLDALDRQVGEGGWALALSADHGVLPFPEDLVAEGGWATRLSREHSRALNAAMEEAASEVTSASELPGALARAAESFDFVARAYTRAEILRDPPVDTFVPLYRNAMAEGRFGGLASALGVEIRYGPGVLTGHPSTGTTHGTPYLYDRHVPLVFLGAGVPSARIETPAATYDAAPTLAEIAGIPFPDDLDGRGLADLPEGG